MTANKENVVFILDVREPCINHFRQKAINSCADVIKQKICQAKKDCISFILVGTEDNGESSNSADEDEPLQNMKMFDTMNGEKPSWQLLIDFYEFVNVRSSKIGNGVKALTLAVSMLKLMAKFNSVRNLRIVFYYDLCDLHPKHPDLNKVCNDMLQYDINLMVVSPNVSPFESKEDLRDHESIQSISVQLRSDCNATICNIDSALPTLSNLTIEQPWMWSSQLKIGTLIKIDVCAVILSKYESKLNLKKVWTENDEVLTRKFAYFIGGNEVEPDKESLIDGYMVGGTPVAYDESLNKGTDGEDDGEYSFQASKGLMLVGFILRSQFYTEYISGPTTYLLMHQKQSKSSALIMDALVRALVKTKRVALCWKVYSNRSNKVSVVVLVPREATESCPASFLMYEVATHAKCHYFQFPKLTTKSTECTEEQYAAIDDLIDAMDLTERNTCFQDTMGSSSNERDPFPLDELPNVFEMNLIDAIERKVIAKHGHSQELLDEKNFVEKYWKIPEEFETSAKQCVNEIKDLFTLEISMAWLEEAKAKMKRAAKHNPSQNDDEDDELLASDVLSYDHVRHSTPAEDFENLIKHYVIPLKNNTKRDIQFNNYASQIRCVIWDLIFKASADINYEKVGKAMQTYRKKSLIFNAFDDYNQWMRSVRNEVIQKSLGQFWQDIVVKRELGLYFTGPITSAEEKQCQEFYNIADDGKEI